MNRHKSRTAHPYTKTAALMVYSQYLANMVSDGDMDKTAGIRDSIMKALTAGVAKARTVGAKVRSSAQSAGQSTANTARRVADTVKGSAAAGQAQRKFEQVKNLVKQNPNAAAALLSAGIGAGVAGEDNRLKGALIGGSLGAAGGYLGQRGADRFLRPKFKDGERVSDYLMNYAEHGALNKAKQRALVGGAAAGGLAGGAMARRKNDR